MVEHEYGQHKKKKMLASASWPGMHCLLETCKGGWALDWSRVHACTMLQDGTTDREAQGSVFGRLKQIACACASLWHRHGRDTATSVRGFPAARVRGGGVAAATGLLHLHKKKLGSKCSSP